MREVPCVRLQLRGDSLTAGPASLSAIPRRSGVSLGIVRRGEWSVKGSCASAGVVRRREWYVVGSGASRGVVHRREWCVVEGFPSSGAGL